jgi:PilZ domain
MDRDSFKEARMLAETEDGGDQLPSSRARKSAIPKPLNAKGSAVEDRRSNLRYPSHVPVEIRIFPSDGSSIPAALIDISLSGLQLEIDATVPKGAQIEILLSKQLAVFGEVRHCRRTGAKYRLGILIQQAFYASPSEEHVSSELIEKYLTCDGLSPAEVLRLREHLKLCTECGGRVNEAFTGKFRSRF